MSHKTILFSLLPLLLITIQITGSQVLQEQISVAEALVGEACRVDKNCLTKQMKCPSGSCQCITGQYSSDDRRSCIATAGADCYETADCTSLANSECDLIDNVCICMNGYSPSTDDKKCLSNSNYLSACEETIQCSKALGDYGVCKESVCVCQSQYHYSATDMTCLRDVGLNEACQNTTQCVTSDTTNNNRVICQDGRCTCVSGYTAVDQTCRAGADHLMLSVTTLFMYWIIKMVI